MASETEQRLEKIARMVMLDVPETQIAKACAVSEGRISQIKASEEFKTILSGMATEAIEQNQTLNDGWDTAEGQALTTILDTLKHTCDKDYALRVAALANKANRRGEFGNRPIDGGASARAILHLEQNFVINLSELGSKILDVSPETEIPRKMQDCMLPGKVEALFSRDKIVDELVDYFPDAVNTG